MTKWFKNKYWRWGLLLISNFFLLQAGSARAVPEVLVPPSPFKGLNGLRFDATGQLYVGSIAEQTTYRVDVTTGKYEIFLNRPDGQADDLIFTPNGQIFFTALLSGEVRTFDPQTNKLATIAAGILAVNPIAQDESVRSRYSNHDYFSSSSASPGHARLLSSLEDRLQLLYPIDKQSRVSRIGIRTLSSGCEDGDSCALRQMLGSIV